MTLPHAVGRRWGRPTVAAVAALAVAGAGLTSTRLRRAERGPVAEAGAGAAAARVDTVAGVAHVTAIAAAERLLPDTTWPREPVRLLWLQGRSAQPIARGAVALDDAGGVLAITDELRVRRPRLTLDGRSVASIAAANGGVWVTTLDGATLRFNTAGDVVQTIDATPLGPANVSSDPSGAHAWLVRPTTRFAFRLDSTAPLLVRLAAGERPSGVGRVVLPAHALLADLANAGSLAIAGDTVYYAPFIRDEIVALRSDGDTLWVASRELPQSTPDPRFEIDSGRAVINYHPVNLGAALGPDGRLYVLSTPGFTTTQARLDVFNRHSGHLLRSARLATALPTIAVAADGRVYLLDAARLLTGSAPNEREAMPPVTFPLLAGGRMTIDSGGGKLTLVNVWASWCVPCRTEMPALDSLRQEFRDEPTFQFVTASEDLRAGAARSFLDEFGFDFPVMLGAGRVKTRWHYPGLPFTVLLDTRGRIVQRWIGFTGADQIDAIRGAIAAELARTSAGAAAPAPVAHEPHSAHARP